MSPFTERDPGYDEDLLDDLNEALSKKDADPADARRLARELYRSTNEGRADLIAVLYEVISLLDAEGMDDARLRLGRWLNPKWQSVGDCAQQYTLVMEGQS